MRVGKYTIEPDAFFALPESIAREHCLLPLALSDGKLRLVAGHREPAALDRSLRVVNFLTNLKIRYSIADFDTIAALVNELFSGSHIKVSRCALEFEVKCSKQWLELTPTADPAVRNCETCSRAVYWADDEAAALSHAQLGRCVALYTDGILDSVGMLRYPDEGEPEPV